MLDCLYYLTFLSNRRPPADIPDDAIIVRSGGETFFTPPSRPRKRKLGLGNDPHVWIEKIRRGEIVPCATVSEKVQTLITFFCRFLQESFAEDFSLF